MGDFAPFETLNPEGDPGILLIGDHASNALPGAYGDLGLPPNDLERHIAYDVGTRGLIGHLSDALNAPAVLCGFSRLLIDPNRGEDDPTLVMKLSDGAIIPGNRHADSAEIEHRLARYYRPYRGAVATAIARAESLGGCPAIFSLHSFTPQLRLGAPRPWDVGVLWAHDDRLARPLLAALEAMEGLCVGENQPYSGALDGDSMWSCALNRGAPYGLIEVRNDLIADPEGQRAWAARLAPALAEAAQAADLTLRSTSLWRCDS